MTDLNQRQAEIFERFADAGRTIPYGNEIFNSSAWDYIGSRGFWSLPFEETGNGTAIGWWNFYHAFRGLSSTCRDFGFLLSMVAHAGALRLVDCFGSEKQKEAILPLLISGNIASTAITEPQGGSDVARVTTKAACDEGVWRLYGHKAHITNGPIATLYFVVGHFPSAKHRKNIGIFFIDSSSRVRPDAPENMLGSLSSPTGDLHFDGAPFDPDQHAFGINGDGMDKLYWMITLDRILYAVIAAGQGRLLLKECMTYTRERQSFGRSISGYQYVQSKLVDMKIAIECNEAVAERAFGKLIGQDRDAIMLGSVAKLTGSEFLWRTVQDAMVLFGHSGYQKGYISGLFNDIAAVRIAGGTSDIQRINIFNQMFRGT